MLFSARHDGVQDRLGRTPASTPADARRRLQPLVARAGELDLRDTAGWEQLRRDAATVVPDLTDAAPAAVAGALVAAWHRATRAWPDRQHRR